MDSNLLSRLADEYRQWCIDNKLSFLYSADELLAELLQKDKDSNSLASQIAWVSNFMVRWEKALELSRFYS